MGQVMSQRQKRRRKTKQEDGARVGSYMHQRRVQRAAEAAAGAAVNSEAVGRFLEEEAHLTSGGDPNAAPTDTGRQTDARGQPRKGAADI